MTDEIATRREQLAATRARIDDHLEELTAHVPDREHLTQVAAKYGAAALAATAALGAVAVTTRSRLARRRDRRAGREYAEALVAALPEVAEAYRAHVADRAATAVVPAGTPLPELGAAPAARRGVPSLVLAGLGLLAGVAASRRFDGR